VLSPSATTAVLVSRSASEGGGNTWSLTTSTIVSRPIAAKKSTLRIAHQLTWVAECEGDMSLPPQAGMRKVEVWGI
jgi:hypothetical protein